MKKGMYVLLILIILWGMTFSPPLYGGIQEVCSLEQVAQNVKVVTPDVRNTFMMYFKSPCDLIKMGERKAAIRKLKGLIPFVESYVGREITRQEADRIIQYINQALKGL